MSLITLKDILISARQEAHRMRHYFLGVEHVFIALLDIKHGLAGIILTQYGLTNEYVIDAVRRKAGKGSKHRLWAGIPNTPRTEVIFGIAQEIAHDNKRSVINERDLLIAIFEEDDSIPSRVLTSLGIDILEIKQKAETVNPSHISTGTFTRIDISPNFVGELSHEDNFILRRMFHGYTSIRVETSLLGGYTSSQLLVVTPIRVGDRSAASVVVKIGHTDAILDEAQRYDKYVKDTLPPLTARLEDKPIAPDSSDYAGLKYTFLTDSAGNPTDMRGKVNEWSGSKLGEWLHQSLYGQFGEKWWKQARPYRFEAWREYDWLLPPILTLKVTDPAKKPSSATVLRFPIRRGKVTSLDLGEIIAVDNFIVYKVEPERGSIRLALAQGESTARAYQIEVQGINFDEDTYFRGEVVDRIVGTVWKTRDDELMACVSKLMPDFEARGNSITVNNFVLPNPVKFYNPMLDAIVMGTISTIHGDLHLGNILIGPSDGALLIDFARTRDGHSIFDWANLEISILSELVVPKIDDTWDDVRQLMAYLAVIDQPQLADQIPEDIYDALKAIIALREIVAQSLAKPDDWHEYSLTLAFTALRAMTWETMSITSRRLMYLIAAFAMYHFNRREIEAGGDRTPSPEETDYFTD
ncbi:MAG: Clp protease N-terminal domain-containing protein [Phototrophicaceae bacterium]